MAVLVVYRDGSHEIINKQLLNSLLMAKRGLIKTYKYVDSEYIDNGYRAPIRSKTRIGASIKRHQ